MMVMSDFTPVVETDMAVLCMRNQKYAI